MVSFSRNGQLPFFPISKIEFIQLFISICFFNLILILFKFDNIKFVLK